MTKVRIFEVIIDPKEPVLNEGAEALYIENNNPAWRELQAYIHIYRNGLYKTADYVGVISPKFGTKSKIGVQDFIKFITKNSGVNVCFVNPFPQMTYWALNPWVQGEYAHPGITKVAQQLLHAIGNDMIVDSTKRYRPHITGYCNFWAGQNIFWESYVGDFLMSIVNYINSNSSTSIARNVLCPTNHFDPAPFLPFIIERFFSTYLSNNKKVTSVAWAHSRDEILDNYCLNEFERILVSGLAEIVESLDRSEMDFDNKIADHMKLYTALFQRHLIDYYKHVPHPHTGRCFLGPSE